MRVANPVQAKRKPVVLCVDDDPAVLSCLLRLLRREPYQVETEGDPEHALERVAKGDVSLVLVDQRMPGMCGSDFTERVRQVSPGTLRVMLTAYPGNVFVHHGLSDSVQWLMSKPWNDEALKITLVQLLQDPSAAREKAAARRRNRGESS